MGSWRALWLPLAGALLFGNANAAVSSFESTDVPMTYMVEFVNDYVLRPSSPPFFARVFLPKTTIRNCSRASKERKEENENQNQKRKEICILVPF